MIAPVDAELWVVFLGPVDDQGITVKRRVAHAGLVLGGCTRGSRTVTRRHVFCNRKNRRLPDYSRKCNSSRTFANKVRNP